MKRLTIPPISIGLCLIANAQEPTQAKWNVELPPPVVQTETAQESTEDESVPIEFTDLTSRTKQVDVIEAPEMPDLPPVTGRINVTVKLVQDPQLPSPPPPPPPLDALEPTDPDVIARLEELRETYRGTELVFLSASVHMANKDAANPRTLLRIYPNGQVGQEVLAWSNINFLHLTGQGGYRVNHADGTFQDIGLLMGVGPIYGEASQRLAEQAGHEYQAPEIPSLPDLATAGPAFAVVQGEADSPAMATLEQIHDLFRASGDVLKEQYLAREQAREERKAYLLANPPQPADVTVRFWRKARPETSAESEAPAQ